jgi:hypothetical protein
MKKLDARSKTWGIVRPIDRGGDWYDCAGEDGLDSATPRRINEANAG